jgi:hypothetical protein
MQILDILLASNIKRFSIVKTIHSQSVAEHSFNVCMIARAICQIVSVEDTLIIKYALDHDLDEVFTGDLPTPAKKRLNISSGYNGKSFDRLNNQERVIVKLADQIDGIHFLVDNQIGRHGSIVAEDLVARYEEFCDKWRRRFPYIIEAAGDVVEQLTSGEYEVEKKV